MKKINITIFILSISITTALFAGCSDGTGNNGDEKSQIIEALQRGYPIDKKPDAKTSNYELFKFEPLEDVPEGAEKTWCVNFLFTNQVDKNAKPARWIGFGSVVKKDGKYSYEFSTGCKLSGEEQKKIYELKNAG